MGQKVHIINLCTFPKSNIAKTCQLYFSLSLHKEKLTSIGGCKKLGLQLKKNIGWWQ